jgi:outer membrane protein
MRRAILFATVLLMLPLLAHALTVDETVELALKNNPLVKEALYRLEAQKHVERSAFTKRLPKITMDYQYTHMKEEPYAIFHYNGFNFPSTPNMPPMDTPSKTKLGEHQDVKWGIQATLPIFTGFYLETVQKIEKLGVKVYGFEEDTTKVNVAFIARKAYYDVLLAQKTLDTAKETVRQFKSHLKDAQSYYEQGLVPYNDVLKAKVALSAAIQRFTYAKENLETSWVNLNLVIRSKDLSRHHPLSFSLEEGVERKLPYLPNLYQKALLNHPQIKAVERGVEQLQLGVRLAKSEYYPKVNLFSRYEQHGDNLLANNNDYNNRENFMVGVKADLMVFDWFGRKHRVMAAKGNYLAAKEGLEELKDKVRLGVRKAYAAVMVAKENIETARAALAQAKEDLRITRLQYSKQIAKSSDVIDSEQALTNAESNYNNAIYNYHLSLAALAQACGLVDVERLYQKEAQ